MEGLVEITELSQFKNLGPMTPTTNIDIPEKNENRRPTDKHFTIVYIAFWILLLPFLIYTLSYADSDRLLGIDSCGNVCGKKNYKYEQWECTGQDNTNKKYLKKSGLNLESLESEDHETSTCVEKCDFHADDERGLCTLGVIDTRAEDDIYYSGFGSFLIRASVIFRLLLCFSLSVGISIGTLYLFRCAVGAVVWSILIGCFILTIIFVVYLWVIYAEIKDGDATGFLIFCILSTIFALVYLAAMYYCRNRIKLVILLLKETTNAVFAMPTLMIVPVSTFVALLILFIYFIVTLVYLSTAGELTEEVPNERYTYQYNGVMGMTVFYNIVMIIWTYYFITGVQYMAIAGAVSEWYFSQDNSKLQQPVKRSFITAYKFHLGSVAFGSLIITILTILRAIVRSIKKSKWIRSCMGFVLDRIQIILEYVTKRAYIIIAMHGEPFLKSGKRAGQLIVNNILNLTAISFITKFTLFAAKCCIVYLAIGISKGIFSGADERYVRSVLCLIFLVTLLITFIVFGVFETTIDTIFMCFCEDSLLNDGMARPYAMSKDLMEFFDSTKLSYGEKKVNPVQEFANDPPPPYPV